MFNFEVDIGGFGVVLGFSAAGASIDPQPLEQLLVTLSTSPALQGTRLGRDGSHQVACGCC
eukprot:scaffold2691_cov417-Prasinococcus_capsulatus_cf.AAC.17